MAWKMNVKRVKTGTTYPENVPVRWGRLREEDTVDMTPQQRAEAVIKWFNATLSPNESPRELEGDVFWQEEE